MYRSEATVGTRYRSTCINSNGRVSKRSALSPCYLIAEHIMRMPEWKAEHKLTQIGEMR